MPRLFHLIITTVLRAGISFAPILLRLREFIHLTSGHTAERPGLESNQLTLFYAPGHPCQNV